MQKKTFKEEFKSEYEETIKFTGGGVGHSTAVLNASGWYTILKTEPNDKINSELVYGKTALFSLTKSYENSDNQACMIAMAGAYRSPVFSDLENSKADNNFRKIRMTQKENNGAYVNYIEINIIESAQNKYFIFLHNQSVTSEDDIIYETVPFLPAEEGTTVIGVEQEI